jgi:hypothetical protein
VATVTARESANQVAADWSLRRVLLTKKRAEGEQERPVELVLGELNDVGKDGWEVVGLDNSERGLTRYLLEGEVEA